MFVGAHTSEAPWGTPHFSRLATITTKKLALIEDIGRVKHSSLSRQNRKLRDKKFC